MLFHPSTAEFCSVNRSRVFRASFFWIECVDPPPGPAPGDSPAWVRGDFGWIPGPGFDRGSDLDMPAFCDFCHGKGCDLCRSEGVAE